MEHSDESIERAVLTLREMTQERRGRGISAVMMLEEQIIALRKDAERLNWLAERLQDVQIDGADPTEHYQRDDGEDEPWPALWRRAIDAAMLAPRDVGAA